MHFVRQRELGISFAEGGVLLRVPTKGFGAKVPTFAVEILTFCESPRAESDVAARYGETGARLFRDLRDAGFLVDASLPTDHSVFFENFASIDVHRRMLGDEPRLSTYAAAIAAYVKPGMAVLDAGTGTGILATMAAHAGARIVYAVDNSDILDVAREVTRASGVGDRVRCLRGNFRDLRLPEPVDVIITETFGALGLAEGGVADIGPCADRNLRPGGLILPGRMSLHFAPVTASEPYEHALHPFRKQHHADLTVLRASALARGMTLSIQPSWLGAAAATVRWCALGEVPYGDGTAEWDVPSNTTLYGFAAWFDLQFGDHPTLSTGPEAPATHWKQQFLPCEPTRLAAGVLSASFDFSAPDDDPRGLLVAAEWNTAAQGAHHWRLR